MTALDQKRRRSQRLQPYLKDAVETLQNLSQNVTNPSQHSAVQRDLDDLAGSYQGGRRARRRIGAVAEEFKEIPAPPSFGLYPAEDQNAAQAVLHGTATPEQQARYNQFRRDVETAEQQREKVKRDILALEDDFTRRLGR